ncbi:PREDICTED: uncharacterized protein LOC106815733 [Priapulus caudatus]|uniref:TIMELESS-interacting protein n=1 Tax=Priapulus caudatus TaxID=37621 RepID=A0ABM1EU53_PRICU|nr:PREDICTED: uncharacterized protein LOC106815733 [Priapulus caudatus]XP_014675725.1 PREDICTED: uncharacterized protein LOC106815733 [Priapulus caudatus]
MMQSIDLEMDDLFGDDIGDDIVATAQLNGDMDQGDIRVQQDGAVSDDGVMPPDMDNKADEKKVRRTLRPQPKLDPTRLCGDRGLPILTDLFKNVQFKGKGHEVDDLNKLMLSLEHWGHRLFPKMPFDEFLQRLETLGKKKAVQVCLSKIRMDMPILDDDFVLRGEDEERDGEAASSPPPPRDEIEIMDEEEEFDELVADKRQQHHHGESSIESETAAFFASPENRAVLTDTMALSSEQLSRIEANKRRAMEKRQARSHGERATFDRSLHDRPTTDAADKDVPSSSASPPLREAPPGETNERNDNRAAVADDDDRMLNEDEMLQMMCDAMETDEAAAETPAPEAASARLSETESGSADVAPRPTVLPPDGDTDVSEGCHEEARGPAPIPDAADDAKRALDRESGDAEVESGRDLASDDRPPSADAPRVASPDVRAAEADAGRTGNDGSGRTDAGVAVAAGEGVAALSAAAMEVNNANCAENKWKSAAQTSSDFNDYMEEDEEEEEEGAVLSAAAVEVTAGSADPAASAMTMESEGGTRQGGAVRNVDTVEDEEETLNLVLEFSTEDSEVTDSEVGAAPK